MEKAVKLCEELIRRGISKEKLLIQIRQKFANVEPEEIYEIAKCRIKMKNKYTIHKLYFDLIGLRYSTPEIVGRYRAKRIKNTTIADVSCGVGMQAIFFSFTNKEVLGIDLNSQRIKYAILNAKAYHTKNIEFITGNAFAEDIIKIAKNYDIIFSDPSRPRIEKERSLKTLEPSPLKIMEKYGKRDYVFDLPPQISMEKLPENWEKEYISVNGEISRLTAYTGGLKAYDRVAISLPFGSKFATESYKEIIFTLSNKLREYVYIVDQSLYYAHLLGEFAEKTGVEYISVRKKRTIATADEFIKNGFLRAYNVICKSSSLQSIINCLRENSIGKVTLRFNIDPGKYWEIRKNIERQLKGCKKGALFKIGDLWIGATNVT